jgi:DNA-directed RNA polymerase specialized sigma54-like protein
MPNEINVKVMFGSQAANKGDKDPASANVLDIIKNNIKTNESKNPNAI